MQSTKRLKQIILPSIILLCAAVGLAQMAGMGKSSTQKTDEDGIQTEELRKRTADDPWSELERIYQVFKQNGFVSYTGTMVLKEEEGTDILESADFSGEINGRDHRYTIDSVEFIHKGGLSLNVFHRDKLVIAGKENLAANAQWNYANIDSLKAFAKREGASAQVFLDKQLKVLKIENVGNSDVLGYEIYYDPQGYSVSSVVLHLASIEDLGSDDVDLNQEGDVTSPFVQEETEQAPKPDTAVGPVITFNLYRLELQYKQFNVLRNARDFDPVKKIGQPVKAGFQLNDQFADYRLVWTGEEKKRK
ncbi:MAG TPA: hypothetical protein VMR70_08620 [Flavisolibacter sp.]|nr:hypothetical protein [Flavisolibacter sp.]